jgi:exonuclease III
VASRWPLEPVDPPAVPWPETVVSVLVHSPGRTFELHAVHVPNSRNGWIKVETCEAIHARLARPAEIPRALCGDLNTPRRETPEGEVVTFARDRHRRLRPERGERWDAAETALLTGLGGMVDVFRALHGWERRELSWAWPRFPRSGYRLDHLIASPELGFTRCEYLHDLRAEGLSDHSALEADFG